MSKTKQRTARRPSMFKIIDCAACGLPYIGACRVCRNMPPANLAYLRALHGLPRGDRRTLRPLALFTTDDEPDSKKAADVLVESGVESSP
jgi:hypothetical protein